MMPAVTALEPEVLFRIFAIAAGVDSLDWTFPPDYPSLRSFALTHSAWRHPAQSVLAYHVRITTDDAMRAIRTREAKRMLANHKTVRLEVDNQYGMDVYWALDRFNKGLKAFRLVYDSMRGSQDGQAERDEEWLEWEVLRHPSLVGITNLCCKADFQEPADLSLLTLPLTDLTFGKLPLAHSPTLHRALFTGCKSTLRSISLEFNPVPIPALPSSSSTELVKTDGEVPSPPKTPLESLIAEFQEVAPSLEHLTFLNKPDINFLMSLHSKMNATKMALFYSCTYPLLPNALAPFNILALAAVNNGSALSEFRFAEADPRNPTTEDVHEALLLRYIAAFGSRLDSFNMLGRRFKFVFPREWSARFVKRPEIARFLDRAGARGCDVQCGDDQHFKSTAKAMEKRKGKRAAAGGGDDSDAPSEPTPTTLEEVLQQAVASASAPPSASSKGKSKAVDKGKGKAVDKGKGKAVEGGGGEGEGVKKVKKKVLKKKTTTTEGEGKGKGKAVEGKGKGKARADS